MNENQDNSNLQPSSEENSKHDNLPSEKKDNLESEQTIEPDKENSINKYSSLEKKKARKKSSFLLLFLLMALGAGFYFYAYKKDSGLSKTLSEGLRKSFSPAPQSNNPPDNDFKKIPVKSQKVTKRIEGEISLDKQPKKTFVNLPEKIVKQSKRANVFDQIITEKDKTINLLRNEILSLKSDLIQKHPPPQRSRIKKPHISGSFLEEQSEEITPQKKKETTSKTNILSAVSLPTAELLNQQSHLQKKPPLERSEEVKTYLNFIETTGENFIGMIEKGWVRFRALVAAYRKSN
jgi:hypothetical protein